MEHFFFVAQTRFYDLIDLYENAVTVHLTLPASDKETLERLGIDGGGDCLSALLPAAAGGCPSPLDRDASVSPDAASEDSLSHLERERALSEDGDDDEPASILVDTLTIFFDVFSCYLFLPTLVSTYLRACTK